MIYYSSLNVYDASRQPDIFLCYLLSVPFVCVFCLCLFVLTFVCVFLYYLLSVPFCIIFCLCLFVLSFACAFCMCLLSVSFCIIFCLCLFVLSFVCVFLSVSFCNNLCLCLFVISCVCVFLYYLLSVCSFKKLIHRINKADHQMWMNSNLRMSLIYYNGE